MLNVKRCEYPRPSLKRSEESWLCLNGQWGFEIDKDAATDENEYSKKTAEL